MKQDYSHIELTMDEEFKIIQQATQEKHYNLLKARMAELAKEGKDILLADKEILIEDIDVTQEELQPYIDIYKEKKFYHQKTNEYLKNLNEEKEAIKVNEQDYNEYVVNRLFDLIRIEKSEENFDKIFAGEFGKVFVKLNRYFQKSEKSTLDPDKGIILMGPVGTGKSTIIRSFERNPKQSFNTIPCKQISLEFKDKGVPALEKYFHPTQSEFYRNKFCGWHFEDLGTEIDMGNYGAPIPVMDIVISTWYDNKYKYSFNNLIITTNLDGPALKQRYGLRMYDRLKEMYNVLVLGGQSLRK